MNMKDLAKKYNLTKDDYWKEQRSGKYIITHDACQKIAHKEGISFAPPQIINSEKDFVRMVVSAKKGEVVIWKTGEADTKNCKNLYLFAMCEKRAKDRCTLSLINAYQWGIYSDVEADSFAKPKYEHRTEEQVKEFVELKGHPAFDGLADYSNKQWKKCNSIKDYEDVLVRMRAERDKFDNITGEHNGN